MAVTVLRPRPAPFRTKSSRTRYARKQVSYREESSDSDEFDAPGSEEYYEPGPSEPRSRNLRAFPHPSSQEALRKRKSRPRLIGSLKKTKTSHAVPKAEEHNDTAIQSTGKVVPWQTLPYHIWLSIFDYASRPLVNDMYQPTPSIGWILRVALCCKAFAEPALSALYYSPPLSPPARAYGLLEQLATRTDDSTFNYRAKIKYLDPEASCILLHKFSGQEPIDIGTFTAFTPQLRGICIHLLSDNPRLRKELNLSTSIGGKGVYYQSLFVALEEQEVRLQNWTWNQSLGRQTTPLSELKEVHKKSPFRTLKNLSFINYGRDLRDKTTSREETLAEAISILPNLQSLSFRLCTIVGDRFMRLLPDNLQALHIFDCGSLKSSGLNTFLQVKGRNIRQLNLDHNISLNLSFLTDLAENCPNLERFKMDLVYFNTFVTVRDSDPKYDVLFRETERPSWPKSLQSLELYHLRKWSLCTAEVFFSSLIDAASSLPNLRQLKIKASLEASGWRDRVEFRDKITQRLRHVFLRRSPAPNPYLKSIQAFKAFKKEQSNNRHDGRGTKRSATSFPTTRSSHKRNATMQDSHLEVAGNMATAEDSDSDVPLITACQIVATESDSDAPLVKLRRSTRPRFQKEDMYALSESSPNTGKTSRRRRRRKLPDESSSEDSALDEDVVEPVSQRQSGDEDDNLFVQGMCDVVDILIDNQRPTDEQLKEADFQDDEASGDEDWNGDDDMPGEGGYAW